MTAGVITADIETYSEQDIAKVGAYRYAQDPSFEVLLLSFALDDHPPTCLDYVVAHELAHLLEPSHNAQFHALLARAYPDEGGARALLRRPARELAAAKSTPTRNTLETVTE